MLFDFIVAEQPPTSGIWQYHLPASNRDWSILPG